MSYYTSNLPRASEIQRMRRRSTVLNQFLIWKINGVNHYITNLLQSLVEQTNKLSFLWCIKKLGNWINGIVSAKSHSFINFNAICEREACSSRRVKSANQRRAMHWQLQKKWLFSPSEKCKANTLHIPKRPRTEILACVATKGDYDWSGSSGRYMHWQGPSNITSIRCFLSTRSDKRSLLPSELRVRDHSGYNLTSQVAI